MKKIFVLLAVTIIFACGEDMNLQDTVFIEDLHHHIIEFGHSHTIDDLDHSHSDDVLIDSLLEKRLGDKYAEAVAEAKQRADAVVVSDNPFSRIIEASQELLETDGGVDMLNIAIGKGSPEQKLQKILRMPNTRAKQLLIQAYAEHNDWLTTTAQQFGVDGF